MKQSSDSFIETIESEKFTRDFVSSLRSEDSIRFFIRQKLCQFNLQNLSEDDILHEVYLRGVMLTQSGTAIQRASPWMRSTAYNVIRELSRQRRFETDNIDNDINLIDYASYQSNLLIALEDELKSDLALLAQAFQKLAPKEKRLLILRHSKGLSWKEVVEVLQSEDGESFSESTARKLGQRALKRLRRTFHELKPPDQFTTSESVIS